MYYAKQKKRQREIGFENLEDMKEKMDFSWKEVSQLLGISQAQLCSYRNCGKLPATRFYAARDALLLHVEEKAREEREKIMKLFSSSTIS